MSDSMYSVELVRGVPVVSAPAALDAANASTLRATLLHLAATGHVTVVVDLSATTECDAAGRAELARAARRAAAEGGDLRLVDPAQVLSPAVRDSGAGRVTPFPTVAEAVAETPAVRIVPGGWLRSALPVP